VEDLTTDGVLVLQIVVELEGMAEYAKAEAEALREQQQVLQGKVDLKVSNTVDEPDGAVEEVNKAKTDSVGDKRSSEKENGNKT